MTKNYTLTLCRTLLSATALCGVLLAATLTTSGCGAEKQEVTAPPPLNSGPPAGASKDDYMKQMEKMKGRPGPAAVPMGAPPGGSTGTPR